MEHSLDRIMVPFEGDGAGVDQLSWGQAENWSATVRMKTWFPIGGVQPLAPGTTVDDVAAELRYVMCRYQSLRTRVRIVDGERPLQVVAAGGEIALDVADAVDGADPGEVAEALAETYRKKDLDYATQWPVRMAVVRQRGVPTHVVAIFGHMVIDGAGALVMLSELATRESGPVDGMQPLAQAAWQQSPAGRRHSDGALRYWETHLRTIDPRRFTPPTEPARPRFWQASFDSRAMWLAVHAIAERAGVDSAPVLLSIYAMALHRVSGINPVVFRPMVSNRFRPALANVVCMTAQAGLCVIDVDGCTFDEVLARSQKATMVAYKYAYFDYFAVAELIERVSRERGTTIELDCYFNDRRAASRQIEPRPVPARDEIEAALAKTSFRWTQTRDNPSFEQLFVYVDDVPDTIALTLDIDVHAISPADAEALAKDMETLAVTIARSG